MNAETPLMKDILIGLSQAGACMLRVNAGQGWAGKLSKREGSTVTLTHAQPFFGVPKGVHDLIGYTPTLITPDMVGKTLAVFTSVEVKTPKGQARDGQDRWEANVIRDGGRAGFARSVPEALAIANPPSQDHR